MPSKDFQPSTESMTPAERTAAMLQYVRKASELLEHHLQEKGQLPPWVCEKILVSAQNMGMSVSYIRKQKTAAPQTAKKVKASRGDV